MDSNANLVGLAYCLYEKENQEGHKRLLYLCQQVKMDRFMIISILEGETHSCFCIRIMISITENDSCHSLPQNPCKKASKAGEELQSQDNTHLGYNSILSLRNVYKEGFR